MARRDILLRTLCIRSHRVVMVSKGNAFKMRHNSIGGARHLVCCRDGEGECVVGETGVFSLNPTYNTIHDCFTFHC